jgi:hypothetical protein
MTPRSKPVSRVPIKLREPADVGAPHVPPIVPDDDLKLTPRLIALCDRALLEGVADADGSTARRLDPPREAALVNLPRSQMLYVSFNDIRPAERWLPVAHLQPGQLDGYDHLRYLSAKRLFDGPSVPIFMALENLFGRGELYQMGACPGQEDTAARKASGVERVEIESLIEIDPSAPDSGSKVQIIKFRDAWLPLRRISKIFARRQEREQRTYPQVNIV